MLVAVLAAACSSSAPSTSDTTSSGVLSSSGTATISSVVEPQPGAAGIGDPYFALLGNGGYDVSHYDVDIRVEPSSGVIDATTTIVATATQSLSSFNFDLSGLVVHAVRVDGRAASSARNGDELVVRPPAIVLAGTTFTTVVAYGGRPEPRTIPGIGLPCGWVARDGGSYVLSEPDCASTWLPANDHPRDKATFTMHVTVPADLEVAANGNLTGRDEVEGGVRWTYEQAAPMATYLATVVIDQLRFTSEPGPRGITIRNAIPEGMTDAAVQDFAPQAEMLGFFSTIFGPYPFDAYGAVLAPDLGGLAIETQTLSLFDERSIDGTGRAESTIAHELAHQWFGDSVSVASWRDIWLNEGFATYAEWLWSEHAHATTAAAIAADVSSRSGLDVNLSDPGLEQLFAPAVYQKGALALQALRETLGDDAFFRVLSSYATRYRGANASIADFEAEAQQVSGVDLTDFFAAWL